MGMAGRHSWLHTSFHICRPLQVSATTGHGLALSSGIYVRSQLTNDHLGILLDNIAKIAAGRVRSCC